MGTGKEHSYLIPATVRAEGRGVPPLPMMSPLLIACIAFVAFGFVLGTLIWLGLVARRILKGGAVDRRRERRRTEPAQAVRPGGLPDRRRGFDEAPLHAVPRAGDDVRESDWVSCAGAPRETAGRMLNFPR